MNPVIHFEMPYTDKSRASAFYSKAFDWQMQDLGEQMGDYVLAGTTAADDKGMVQTPGHINGGLFPFKADCPAQYPNVVIGVDDINAAMEKVRQAGGSILGEPVLIPGIGNYVSFMDTENNRVAMLEPLKA